MIWQVYDMAILKLNQTYTVKKIADKTIAVPVSETAISRMMLLNETGYLLWTALEKGTDKYTLQQILLREYDVSQDMARADVEAFLDQLQQIGALEL